jgi:hypothetical protein
VEDPGELVVGGFDGDWPIGTIGCNEPGTRTGWIVAGRAVGGVMGAVALAMLMNVAGDNMRCRLNGKG